MNRLNPLVRLGLCVFALTLTPSVLAEPALNGVAENIELNKERFIAALYTSSPSTAAADLLRNDGERRMELRITAPRLSAKGLNNMWIEGMAINNPSTALREESESLSQLVNMIRRSVVRGDVLKLDTQPGAGMTVTLNDVQLGTIQSENFFSMVLRTWIGNVPLSSEFKKNLLAGGQVDADLRNRFALLQPTEERIATVQGWSAPAPAPEPEPAQTVAAAATISPPRPAVDIDRPRIEVPVSETIEALRRNPEQTAASLPAPQPGAQPAESEPEQAEEQTAATPAEDNTAAEPSEPVEEPAQIAQTEPQSPAANPNTPPPLQTSAVVAIPEEEAEEEEEAFISAEAIFERQIYISNVLKKAWAAIDYPQRALQRNQQGTVRLTVTVDKNGNLIDTVTIEESRYGLLNREATRTFSRAEPYDPFPESITDETISFTAPITFQLTN